MSILLILLVVLIVFGGGSYFGGDGAYRGATFPGIGAILLVIILLAVFGVIHI